MTNKSELYDLLRSGKRGSEEVESKLKEIVNGMETPDNLEKMAKAISVEWRNSGQKSKPAKMDFSKFEEKLNRAKQEFFDKKD